EPIRGDREDDHRQRQRRRPALSGIAVKASPILLLAGFASLATNLCALAAGAPITPGAREFFENKIRPVLAAECYECHNAKKTKGGLRLDYRAGWQMGGDTGDAIVPGDPKRSLLL